jgi:hypothetical protein
MYWNNPIKEYNWPSIHDPIIDSLHNGKHCIFYDPIVNKNQIRVNQPLQDLCNWINTAVEKEGIESVINNPHNYDQLASLVKLNIWVDDLPRRGNVKPMLLQYIGRTLYESGTGESRLKALERIDTINTVTAFICTHRQYYKQFDHLESVTNFNRFAELCGANDSQSFLFRFTDEQALYGLDWYEYNSNQTSLITPSEIYCVSVLSNYIKQHPNTIFTPEWFDNLINWNKFEQ